jgi:hydroxypyruvate reductase/glycerate 2-kinase
MAHSGCSPAGEANVTEPAATLRNHARAIWQAAVDAVRPQDLIRKAFGQPELALREAVDRAPRILVVGAGKAGAAMSEGLEHVLARDLSRLHGVVNVPRESVRPLQAIRLHAARLAGTNQPTGEGVEGAEAILALLDSAGPDDVCLCLLSGGGSALLPAPVESVTLEEKQQVTRLLHECGATITEMNAVRKHLSRCKGGRLAAAFKGRLLISLIISDVIGDPLDVIASGPTAPDPSTFADALAVLRKYGLRTPGESPDGRLPENVLRHLQQGAAGQHPETPKKLPANIRNLVIGNNALALAAAQAKALDLGYRVVNLGAYLEGETKEVALVHAGIVRSIRADSQPVAPPACLISGGETTVTLSARHGLGGRNQEFVLATLAKLGLEGLHKVVILSGGTDGEDGPTDAAGALADAGVWQHSESLGHSSSAYLERHDAYHFFEATNGLLRTGLTQTNVMDVRVILVT